MDELARQANTRAGVDIGAVLRGCNADAADAALVINHAEVLGGPGGEGVTRGGSCAAAARARARRSEEEGGSRMTTNTPAYEEQEREKEREQDDDDDDDDDYDGTGRIEREMQWERVRERERERERREREMEYNRGGKPATATTTVAIGTTVVVDDESDSFSAALAGEYPAVVNPNPQYARSASGTGAALIENGVFDMYAAFGNLGKSLHTAAYIWTERATQQHLDRQRRERATQAVFLRRMSGLMLEASFDLEASARGVPLSGVGAAASGVGMLAAAQGVSGGGGGGPASGGGGGGRTKKSGGGGTGRRGNSVASASSPWWPLWTWDRFFREE